eukprot:CAMPEP_0194419448 /NCGR_PEP_ID=MMETSP0176-20130528/18585_1 /TAXON_ID=216777 /ORGANISM="Proboscia alata, Strain PI-D3" /LENGTH=177 /DNA_ID=CAMNT_0039226401 /DNA_START=91 /DNA_END=622 /DNA_ORIENTATION=-
MGYDIPVPIVSCGIIIPSNNSFAVSNQAHPILLQGYESLAFRAAVTNRDETRMKRQFYIQGCQHFELLVNRYWEGPMKELVEYWSKLENRIHSVVELLLFASEGRQQTKPNAAATAPPSRAERKRNEKCLKAISTIESLLGRNQNTGNHKSQSSALELIYAPLAEVIDERATMREQW